MSVMPRGLIVGAGLAGVAAAQRLTAHGWAVTLLDAAARAGGRCATRCFDGTWADYGAQYFTARTPEFRRLTAQKVTAGRLRRWQPAICTAKRNGGIWQLDTSPDTHERLTGPSGLGDWAAALAAASGATLHLDTRVNRVVAHEDGWRAQTSRGVYGGFDALILAVAPAVARDLLADGAPPALAAYRMSPCHALVVRAPRLAGCEAIFVQDGPLGWVADNGSKPGQPPDAPRMWTLHATPAWSAAHFDDPVESVIDSMVETFAALSGRARATIEPVSHYRWRHARPGRGTAAAAGQHLYDPAARVAIAGDWLAGGRVEGAWLSGRAAARAVVAR